MERDLVELFEAVKKAADAASADGGVESSPEEDRCLDALNRLKEFPVNYQVLVSTQVGKRLRHLTKHSRKKIQALASDLVEIWKNIIIEETMKTKKNGCADIKDSVNVEHTGTSDTKKVQRVNSMKVEKVSKVESDKLEKNDESGTLSSGKVMKSESITTEKKVELVKIEKSSSREHSKVEKMTREEKQTCVVKNSALTKDVRKLTPTTVGPPKLNSVIYCKDPSRDKIRELLSEALCKVSGEVDEDVRDEANSCDPFRVAVSVESAMFEKWGKSTGAQKFKYRSVMFNIKDPKNPDFRRKVLLGHVSPERILELIPEEMASTERQLQNYKIKEKALFDCERGQAPKATTDEFKCGRCGKRKCTYYQLQTRSADEPMTTFVTCVNCDNHWKFC